MKRKDEIKVLLIHLARQLETEIASLQSMSIFAPRTGDHLSKISGITHNMQALLSEAKSL